MIGELHNQFIFQRRIRVLADCVAVALGDAKNILDVGCGDGALAKLIATREPWRSIEGVDVLPRETAHIPVTFFDGKILPYEDKSVDAIMCVDVLHHTDDPKVLLREFCRVARHAVVIKDHFRNGLLAQQRLALMDWVGNARYGVNLPYNYLSRQEWEASWQACGLRQVELKTDLGLYAFPLNIFFEHGLHLVVRLQPEN